MERYRNYTTSIKILDVYIKFIYSFNCQRRSRWQSNQRESFMEIPIKLLSGTEMAVVKDGCGLCILLEEFTLSRDMTMSRLFLHFGIKGSHDFFCSEDCQFEGTLSSRS